MSKKRPSPVSPVPLTKAQLQTDAGKELLELVEAITDDGLVSKAEVTRLHRWLHRHESENLPAVAFLGEEVDQLRKDEEAGETWPRRRLHRALERVLPKDLREVAKERRQDAEALAFNWGPKADDSPPVRREPAMREKTATLLLPAPELPMKVARRMVEERIKRGEMKASDILRDLTDPPPKVPKKPEGAKGKKKTDAKKADPPPADVTRATNLPTPDPIARVVVSTAVVARSRYRGEMLWFDERAWAVFIDPEDTDCRYAQEAG